MMHYSKISIGSDHAGFELKKQLIDYLKTIHVQAIDKGTFSAERADYADYGHLVAESVLTKESELGILMCGSGNGINMSANKHKGIRSALCWNAEIAKLAKQHNDANILTLPARFISVEEAKKCVDAFLNEKFEEGRHVERVKKIEC